jgi:hypothetical protein
VSETSNLGLSVEDATPWLRALVTRLDGLASDSVPVRGICWYSRGDQYDRDSGLVHPVGRVTQVGLYDADRRARPVATVYADLARRRSGRSTSLPPVQLP